LVLLPFASGIASANTNPGTVLVQHGAKEIVPAQSKTLASTPTMKEGLVAGQSRTTPHQPFGCDYDLTETINRVVSTASAWQFGCYNVDYCVQIGQLQWYDKLIREWVDVGLSGRNTGCGSTHKGVGSASCQADSTLQSFRALGIFTFLSDFGDQVGPFDRYTNGGGFYTICG
jgi:hypothetical protein